MERFVEEATSGAGSGMLLGAILVLAVVLLLPGGKRRAARGPATLLALHVACVLLVAELPKEAWLHERLAVLASILLIACIGRCVYALAVDSVLLRWLARPLPKILRDVLKTLIAFAVVLLSLRAAGVDPGSLLTTSALLTAVIGLSLQETLGNMFAGLSLQAQQPFEVGDWIQLESDERLSGRVLEINWRETKIETADEYELIVPNGAIAKLPIRNYSKPSPHTRRAVEVLCPYEEPPERVQRTILEALEGTEGVLSVPRPSVVTALFADSGINYTVRYYTAHFARRYEVDGAVRDRIWYALKRAGISIPFPIRVTYHHEVGEESLLRDRRARIERRRRAIDSVALFSALSDAQRSALAERVNARLYTAGETILRADERGDAMFILVRGAVRVLAARGGEAVEVARLGPGEHFGEMSLMTGETRTATVIADEESELVAVNKAAFAALLEEAPELAVRLAERRAALEDRGSGRPAELEEDRRDLLGQIRRFFSLGGRTP